jgi:hypothetical protein
MGTTSGGKAPKQDRTPAANKVAPFMTTPPRPVPWSMRSVVYRAASIEFPVVSMESDEPLSNFTKNGFGSRISKPRTDVSIELP